jgi:hypothetical protein
MANPQKTSHVEARLGPPPSFSLSSLCCERRPKGRNSAALNQGNLERRLGSVSSCSQARHPVSGTLITSAKRPLLPLDGCRPNVAFAPLPDIHGQGRRA